MSESTLPVSAHDIRAAAERLVPLTRRTPVLTSTDIDERVGAKVFFKCENFQRTGAFKFRGAANAVFSLSAEVAARGVVTHSSGNHGAALALAARLRGIPAHVVVPQAANATKIAAVLRHGAKLVHCPPALAAREAAAAQVAAETGSELIHPYNDARVMAGQGTAAFELLQEVGELDTLLVPVSGGGLLSGCATIAADLQPELRVIGVEPAGADDARRSLRAGEIIREPEPQTICDGLRAFLGPLTYAVISRRVHDIVTASDGETILAMRLIWDVLKIIVEPSSALALAALLGGHVTRPGGRIGVIFTGGNVDLDNLPWSQPGRQDAAIA